MAKFTFQDNDSAEAVKQRLDNTQAGDTAVIDNETLNEETIRKISPEVLLAFLTHENTVLAHSWQTVSDQYTKNQTGCYKDSRDTSDENERYTPHVQTVTNTGCSDMSFQDKEGHIQVISKRWDASHQGFDWYVEDKSVQQPAHALSSSKKYLKVAHSLQYYPEYLISRLLNTRGNNFSDEQQQTLLAVIAKKFIATAKKRLPHPADKVIEHEAKRYFAPRFSSHSSNERLLGEIQYQLVGQAKLTKQTHFKTAETIGNVKKVLSPIATWHGRFFSGHWNTKGGDLVNNGILKKVKQSTSAKQLKGYCLDTLATLNEEHANNTTRNYIYGIHKPRLTGETAKRIRFILNNADAITATAPRNTP